jgi:signal transduction histidine kinase
VIPSTRSLRGARARREPDPAGEPPPPERSGVVGRLRRPFRLGPMRLSTRLALTAAAAVCVVLAGFALGTYLLIADRARERLDDSLVQTARQFARAASRSELGVKDFEAPVSTLRPPAKLKPSNPEPAAPAGTKVQVSEGGKPAGAQPSNSPRAPALPAARPTPPVTVVLQGQRYRMLVQRLSPTGDGRQRTIAVARPLADVEATIDQAAWSLGLGALAAALLTIGLALVITRRTLRPLHQVQSAAETVAASQDLSVRIEEGRADEVGRMARAVNLMLERLEGAQDRLTTTLTQQRRFAADASHELRTPLTALKGDIDLLARHRVPEPEREVVLSDMAASVERMGRLVEGLLALARSEGGGDEAEVDLAEIVVELGTAAEVHMAIEAERAIVRGSPVALSALVGNLLDNARRHGDEVWLTLRVEGSWAVLGVRDDGPGVAEADRERIFDRFYRAPSQRGRPGAGLGLAIARSAAERSGGTLDLLPAEEGSGAHFEARLPLARAKFDRASTLWARPRALRTR